MSADASPVYASAFQQPYQGMYQDPYTAAQTYGDVQFTQPPVYQNYSGQGFSAEAPALQWEMPQVRLSQQIVMSSVPLSESILGYPVSLQYKASKLVAVEASASASQLVAQQCSAEQHYQPTRHQHNRIQNQCMDVAWQ